MDRGKRRQERGSRGGRDRNTSTAIAGELWRARVTPNSDFECCSSEIPIERGDFVVIATRFGSDMARILGPVSNTRGIDAGRIRTVERLATDEDHSRREILEEKEEEAYRFCLERIAKLRLAMRLVSAHYTLDEKKVLFYFTVDNRVDFRFLVKDLIARFKKQVELLQISARDESRVVGGMAVCGRQFCCHSLGYKPSPVSIKMAKEQNLSLNPQKILGLCGRLLCCLAYEQDHYAEERKKCPRIGTRVSVDNVNCRVSEVNIFTKTIQLRMPGGRHMALPSDRFRRRTDGAWEALAPSPPVSDQE